MPLPTVDQLKRPTLVYLEQGITDSDLIRDRLASDFRLTGDDLALKLQNRIPTFVNNHAWALVRLQNGGLIERVARKSYAITEAGRGFLRGKFTKTIGSSRLDQVKCLFGRAAGSTLRIGKIVRTARALPIMSCSSCGGGAADVAR